MAKENPLPPTEDEEDGQPPIGGTPGEPGGVLDAKRGLSGEFSNSWDNYPTWLKRIVSPIRLVPWNGCAKMIFPLLILILLAIIVALVVFVTDNIGITNTGFTGLKNMTAFTQYLPDFNSVKRLDKEVIQAEGTWQKFQAPDGRFFELRWDSMSGGVVIDRRYNDEVSSQEIGEGGGEIGVPYFKGAVAILVPLSKSEEGVWFTIQLAAGYEYVGPGTPDPSNKIEP